MTRTVHDSHRGELVGGKGSIFYRAHSYHTKVPPEGILPLLEHFTDPGDRVLDPFCGSGMTGIACLLSGRSAVLSDLSPAAVHITNGYVSRADPDALRAAATALLSELHALERELYGTVCDQCGAGATIEYTVWSDELVCPGCCGQVRFWDAARGADGTLNALLTCPRCEQSFHKRNAALAEPSPVLASVSCGSCRGRSQRPLTPREAAWAVHDHRADIVHWYPTTPLDNSRELWRAQHRDLGIATVADFFTPRNLRALAAAWDAAGGSDQRDALRFAVSAVINRASRRYQWNPKRPTNVLSGTLYVASLTYEFNVFSLLKRKLRAVCALADALAGSPGEASVRQTSATDLSHVGSGSIDYVFTDPPFGSNIYYADASLLWEAWLDEFTPVSDEAVVNSRPGRGAGKTVDDYEKLMAGAFSEVARVMRPEAWASVMFHNTNDLVWSALERALEGAGLHVDTAVAFDKSQPSFKGVRQRLHSERVAAFDLVLHVRKSRPTRSVVVTSPEQYALRIVDAIRAHLTTASPAHRTTPYLHSFALRLLLENGWPVAGFSYQSLEALLLQHFEITQSGWVVADAADPSGAP